MIELESRKTNSRLSANSCENSVERRNFLNPTQKHFNPKEYCKSIEEPDSGKLVPILWKNSEHNEEIWPKSFFPDI